VFPFLSTFGWLACVAYATIPSFWLLIHPYTGYWRAQLRSPYRILLPVWFAMWIALAFITARWRQITLYSVPSLWIAAALLFAIGVWLYLKSGRNFSAKQLGGLPELQEDHPEQRLVTTGIRSHVRHPVYLAHLVEMLAWSIGTGLAVCFGLTAFAVVTGAIMIRTEDRELEKRFGNDYTQYKRAVPAVLPKL
jgi:protein-S-isoprenylcysteine O-methyltransferase Ste14